MSGFSHDFNKLNRLPPYILAEVTDLMRAAPEIYRNAVLREPAGLDEFC